MLDLMALITLNLNTSFLVLLLNLIFFKLKVAFKHELGEFCLFSVIRLYMIYLCFS